MENLNADTPRGDLSIHELRTMLGGEEPKTAEAQGEKETPAAAEENSEAKTAPESGTEEGKQEGQERGADGKFKPKEAAAGEEDTAAVPAGVQKRIDKAVRAQRDAERRAQEAEQRLAETQGSRPGSDAKNAQPPADATPKEKPVAANFDSYEAYVDALTDWKVEQADIKREATTRAANQQNAEKATLQAHSGRVEKARERYADYDDTMQSAASLPISRELHGAIVGHEHGTDVAYELAKNPDEARRIAALSPAEQLVEFGAIAAKFRTQPAAKEKPAEKKPLPKPAAAVGGTAGAKEPDLNDPKIDMATFKRLARAQLKRSA